MILRTGAKAEGLELCAEGFVRSSDDWRYRNGAALGVAGRLVSLSCRMIPRWTINGPLVLCKKNVAMKERKEESRGGRKYTLKSTDPLFVVWSAGTLDDGSTCRVFGLC
jgi:hypothetical protein